MTSIIDLALEALPDSDHYKFIWDECTNEEQTYVKRVREQLLAYAGDDVGKLRWTLDNIYTIARREALKNDPRGRWGHVLRLCERVGCQGRGVLPDGTD
jgi:hypothetical protein